MPSLPKETTKSDAGVKKSVEYLSYCVILEENMFQLYTAVAKKMGHPELNNIFVLLAYDCLKHSKTLEELLKPFAKTEIELKKCDGVLVNAWEVMRNCLSGLSEIGSIDQETLSDFIQSLTSIEDSISEMYSYFLKSKMLGSFVCGISNLVPVTNENFTFVLNSMIEDNLRHRSMLIEAVYFLKKNKLKTEVNEAPFVKYQNPDSWVIQ